jgi:murein DD-endopeptidase MepM/ murein hydrolase activator NlpD
MSKGIVQTLIIGVFAFASFSPSMIYADEISDLQSQIDQRNANIKALEAEIALYQAQADKTSAQAQTLANTIKSLQQTGKKLDSTIKLTQAKISAANLTIQKLGDTITDKEKSIQNGKQSLAASINLMNESDSFSPLQSFLQSKNVSDMWDTFENIFSLQNSIKNYIQNLQGTKQSLETDKTQTETEKTNLKTLADNLTDQQKVVIANAAEQNNLLKQTNDKESAYQALIKQKLATKTAFEKDVFDYESKLKYKLNPSELPAAGSTPFSWPTTDVYITQQFGVTSASGRLYASGSHNGTDFKALMGTPVHAIADGTVAGTGNTDLTCPKASFGNWILIKHDNGLAATFGHLSVISVKTGDKVTRGDIIGYSGNTGYTTGPHLHISVYPNDAVNPEYRASLACTGKTYYMPIAAVNAYLDPMVYFPAISSTLIKK